MGESAEGKGLGRFERGLEGGWGRWGLGWIWGDLGGG